MHKTNRRCSLWRKSINRRINPAKFFDKNGNTLTDEIFVGVPYDSVIIDVRYDANHDTSYKTYECSGKEPLVVLYEYHWDKLKPSFTIWKKNHKRDLENKLGSILSCDKGYQFRKTPLPIYGTKYRRPTISKRYKGFKKELQEIEKISQVYGNSFKNLRTNRRLQFLRYTVKIAVYYWDSVRENRGRWARRSWKKERKHQWKN